MVFGAITIDNFLTSTAGDLKSFLPELILCAIIVSLLFLRLLGFPRSLGYSVLALFGTIAAIVAASQTSVPVISNRAIFSGMLVADQFSITVKVILLSFVTGVILLSFITGIPDREDSSDFFVLLLGSTLGMLLMASAGHLLMAFIAIEMASLPSYALAGFLKGKKSASEGALKYVVYGAAASGVMLYGISLVAGTFGTGSLLQIAIEISYPDRGVAVPVTAFAGVVLIFVGIFFKLSAVPFHFWCPDVFTGASAEVGAFLSVASKAAALTLAARLLFFLGGTGVLHTNVIVAFWALVSITTTTWGNLAALGQSNIKRMLSYSTISHAGLMMMAMTAFDYRAIPPLVYYITSYAFMNFGAFAIVALVRNSTGSEEVSSYDGLARRSPVLAFALAICLLSLLGLPPLAGFAAKFQVFAHLLENARKFSAGNFAIFSWLFFGMILMAGLNTALSAFYYLGIIKRMFLETGTEEHQPILVSGFARIILASVVGGVIALGVWWNPLIEQGTSAGKSFQQRSAKAIREGTEQ